MSLLAKEYFPSLCVEYISISLFCKNYFIDYCKIHLNCLTIFYMVCVLTFKGINHAYLLQMSVVHNKKSKSFIKFTYQLYIC